MYLSALALRFAPWFDRLCTSIADYSGRHPASVPLVHMAYYRLKRMLRKLDALALRFEAGLSMATKPRAARAARAAPVIDPDAPPAPPPAPRHGPPPCSTPGAYGWLWRRVQPAIHSRQMLDQMIHDPATLALAAAAPQAGRILRPLCRMMGIPVPDVMKLPVRPRKSRARQPEPEVYGPPMRPPPEERPMSGLLRVPWRMRLVTPGLYVPGLRTKRRPPGW